VTRAPPPDVYTDLWRAGVIGDPLEAYGDWKTAWAGRTSWRYRRTFSVDGAVLAAAAEVLLVAEGLETNATVAVNGRALLAADDSWVRYTVPVGSLLKTPSKAGGASEGNTITVTFSSVYDSCMFSDPAHSNVTCTGRVYVRQAASSWGWDWVKRYSPQGIWRPIYLVVVPASGARNVSSASPDSTATSNSILIAGAAAAVTDMGAIVRPRPGQPAAASAFDVDVVVSVVATAAQSAQIELRGDWAGTTATTHTVALMAGSNSVSLATTAEGVELWWPAGYGTQRLYNLTATLITGGGRHKDGGTTRALGFRSVRLQTDAGAAAPGDSAGSGNATMTLLVNGVPVLVRGSSLVPLETFNGRTSGARALRLLRSTLAANMNTLRVWGGGSFLPPAFYAMADQLGVMVMHDFMLSWYPNVPYPAFPAFRARVAAEVRQQLTVLAHHPAIVMWTGGNEDQCTRCGGGKCVRHVTVIASTECCCLCSCCSSCLLLLLPTAVAACQLHCCSANATPYPSTAVMPLLLVSTTFVCHPVVHHCSCIHAAALDHV